MGDNRAKKTPKNINDEEDDQVEQLLRQTQDDILLKLTINSHTTSSSRSIDPDLDRRFNALKSNNKTMDPTTKPTTTTVGNTSSDDDLFGRFSALKNSTPSKNNKNSGSTSQDSFVEKFDVDGDNDDGDDEVEKLIKWAIDAARLDPSPPSEDEDSDYDDDDDDNDNDDDYDDDDGNKCKRK